MIKFEARTVIERSYQVEVDVAGASNEEVIAWAAEIALPLVLVTTLVVPLDVDGTRVNEVGVVRFTGTRTQLAALIVTLEGGLTKDEANEALDNQ